MPPFYFWDFWIIFTLIIMNCFSGRLLISSSFIWSVWSCRSLLCSFVCKYSFVVLFLLINGTVFLSCLLFGLRRPALKFASSWMKPVSVPRGGPLGEVTLINVPRVWSSLVSPVVKLGAHATLPAVRRHELHVLPLCHLDSASYQRILAWDLPYVHFPEMQLATKNSWLSCVCVSTYTHLHGTHLYLLRKSFFSCLCSRREILVWPNKCLPSHIQQLWTLDTVPKKWLSKGNKSEQKKKILERSQNLGIALNTCFLSL